MICSHGREWGLAKVGVVGVKGIGSGRSRVRAANVRVAKGQAGNHVHGQRPSGLMLGCLARRPEIQEHQAPEPFVLRTFIIDGMGEGEEVIY